MAVGAGGPLPQPLSLCEGEELFCVVARGALIPKPLLLLQREKGLSASLC